MKLKLFLFVLIVASFANADWRRIDTVPGSAEGAFLIRGLAVDKSGRIFQAAEVRPERSSYQDILVRVFDPKLNIWVTAMRPKDHRVYFPTHVFVAPDQAAFVAISAYDKEKNCGYSVVLRSRDGGATWVEGEKFYGDPQDTKWKLHFEIDSMAADKTGALYLAGNYATYTEVDGGGYVATHSWFVQKSDDGGATWRLVEHIKGTLDGPYLQARATKVLVDSSDRVLVVGSLRDPGQGSPYSNRAVIHMSEDGGKKWTVLDDFNTNSKAVSVEAGAVAVSDEGFIYQAGALLPSDSDYRETMTNFIRKSTDGGKTWQMFTPTHSTKTLYQDIKFIGGRMLLTGQGLENYDFKPVPSESTDGGQTWSIIHRIVGSIWAILLLAEQPDGQLLLGSTVNWGHGDMILEQGF